MQWLHAMRTRKMSKQSSMRHEFAFYTPELSAAVRAAKNGLEKNVTIADEHLWHRLKHVVRAQPGTLLCIFDHHQAYTAEFHAYGQKNKLQFVHIKAIKKPVLTPTIIVMLPLLKREALSDALYTCVELGANHIQMVTTEKSQHAWSVERDNQRCEKIMIAAAEQAKQFTVPTLSNPAPLVDALAHLPTNAFRVHCDPAGTALWDILHQIENQKPSAIVLSFGPEGDLTDRERALLYQHQFVACALTPTVLRATQALVVALGAVRSGGSYD